jgi:hypothetical protein
LPAGRLSTIFDLELLTRGNPPRPIERQAGLPASEFDVISIVSEGRRRRNRDIQLSDRGFGAGGSQDSTRAILRAL